uniref:L-ascorbate oxidase-like n=1 Tax=Rhizophora mucronata TaxID=61149 RepID=A0A2P2N894_RHIMU
MRMVYPRRNLKWFPFSLIGISKRCNSMAS